MLFFVKLFDTLSPSDFYPIDAYNCVLKKREFEIIARNIMVILARTGDKFRKLSWNEYESERKKDKNFTDREEYFFDMVIDYCSSSDKAMTFCENWENILEKTADKYNL